jgi:histidyl-tRNA synthetase
MRDFLPAEKAHRDRVLTTITSTYRAHGFDEIETPVMEDSDRLHAGLGGDNEKLAFGVLKRALKIDDLQAASSSLDLVDLGLRYDLTVPLARFYASHRAELPTVFKAIQAAPVWRAERPQKGRYRQFVQCDIDIIGEPGTMAEAELVTATAAALRALGLDGWSIRVNDRRILTSMLEAFGFAAADHASVLITIDKLDKIAADGVVAELRERAYEEAAVDALETFFRRPTTMDFLPFGEAAIRKALPAGIDEAAVLELAALGEALTAERDNLVFDPFLVRGMGYYTGAIFEIAHAELGYSIGGGGRYDGMIGRFLGTDVPAVGLSLGFERLVDLISPESASAADSVALLFDPDVAPATLLRFKSELVAAGKRVRVEPIARNAKAQYSALAASGYTVRARVTVQTETLEFLPIS